MHAVIRHFSGPSVHDLFHLIEEHRIDLEDTIRSVRGVMSYSVIRTAGGGITVIVCESEQCSEEAVRLATEWIRDNASHVRRIRQRSISGEVISHV
jgi:hypothetical protein